MNAAVPGDEGKYARGRRTALPVRARGALGRSYATPYQSHYESKKLISGHLYQLLTYLSQLAAGGGPGSVGVLLYAGLGPGQRLRYRLGGHTVLIRSLDLNRVWREIHGDLMGIVKELAGQLSLVHRASS